MTTYHVTYRTSNPRRTSGLGRDHRVIGGKVKVCLVGLGGDFAASGPGGGVSWERCEGVGDILVLYCNEHYRAQISTVGRSGELCGVQKYSLLQNRRPILE